MWDMAFGWDRKKGYQLALERHGLNRSSPMVVTEEMWSSDSGYWEVQELLSKNPNLSAIVCASDRLAFNAIRALNDRNMRVPEDVSVIGYTDVQAASSFTPPLTTVRQPIEQMAELVGLKVISLLQSSHPVENCVLKPALIRRGSVSVHGQKGEIMDKHKVTSIQQE